MKTPCFSVAAAALFLGSPTALAAAFDLTGQGGQYHATLAPQLVRGEGGTFSSATLWLPLLIPHDPTSVNPRQPLPIAPVCALVGGHPVAAVATYHPYANNTATDRITLILSATDAAPNAAGASEDIRLRETTIAHNTPAMLLDDGRLLITERENGAQNNLGLFDAFTGPAPAEPNPPAQAPFKVFSRAAVGIGDALETGVNPSTALVVGEVKLGTPSVARDPGVVAPVDDSDLLTAVTLESAARFLTPEQVPACVTGVCVFRGRDNNPAAAGQGLVASGWALGEPGADYIACWPRSSVPTPSTPQAASVEQGRQTQPIIRAVQTPSGEIVPYVLHGIGYSGSIGGGAARPIFLACDTLRMDFAAGDPVPENNTILIEADAPGPVGSLHGRPMTTAYPAPPEYADHWTSDRRHKFIANLATGTFETTGGLSRFDMNARAEIVAIYTYEGAPRVFEIRLYRPTWNAAGNRITGFTFAAAIARAGDTDNAGAPLFVTDLRDTFALAGGGLEEQILPPFSGVAIDDEGRVAFVGVMEKFDLNGDWDLNPATPPTRYLRAVTTGLFVWEPTTESLHLIVKSGQNGDAIADAFPASGPPLNESYALGAMIFGPEAGAFGSASFARAGGLLALGLQSGGNQFVGGVNQELEKEPDGTPDLFLDRGGVLFAPGQLGVQERSARAVALIQIGAFAPEQTCCPGNADKVSPGAVNFDDITAVLANWGSAAPGGALLGDANCDGAVNFDDVTAVLSAWTTNCP